MHATGWSRGLEVTGGGSGVVSHAGLVLLRRLSDRTGTLKIAATWPWAEAITAAWQRIQAIPHPT